MLMDLADDNFLEQIVNEPTRNQNILDLIFTNNVELVHSCKTWKTILSDHNLVEVKTNTDKETPTTLEKEQNIENSLSSLNFFHKNVNWNSINEELCAVDWRMLESVKTADEYLQKILLICSDICEKHVPKRKKKKKTMIPRDRRILMRSRRKLRKKLENANTDGLRQTIENKILEIERELKMSHEKQREYEEGIAVSAIKQNPKYFYAYAKKKLTVKAKIGPLENEDGEIVEEPKCVAEILQNQYNKVYSNPMQEMKVMNPEQFFTITETENNITDITFTDEDIKEAIAELKYNASPGPDNIPAIFLKRCVDAIATPLHSLWRLSLDTGRIPTALTEGRVAPIFKGGSRAFPKNYRPVTLTSHIIKIFERVLRKHLVHHLEEKQHFNPGQHGFRKGRSCLSQLLNHYTHVLEEVTRGSNIDVVYLDFAKAFDKVDHGILLRKLKKVGIAGKIGIWIENFLTSRTQRVVVEGTHSEISRVISGVPQGSVLGPLLFLVMIGDIDETVTYSKVTSFADDTRISKAIYTEDDVRKLKEDLKKIYTWAESNNMKFNREKFELIRYGNNQTLQQPNTYTAGEMIIEEKDSLKDLGVWMSNDCTFSEHVQHITKTAKQMSGWILRTFQSRNPEHLMPLWRSLVVSRLEYVCQLWSPYRVRDIQELEQVQRVFTRKIIGDNQLSYWDRLKKLRMYSLQRRRERYCIMYTWKILEGMVPNPTSQWTAIESQDHPRFGRTCCRRTLTSTSSRLKTLEAESFFNFGPRLFNCLPRSVRDLTKCTTEAFKGRLDRFLSIIPDEPPIPHSPNPRGAASNSIIDQLRFIRMQHKCGGGGLSS